MGSHMRGVLVLGIGSIMRGDDGAGIGVVERLRGSDLPESVDIRDAGGAGPDLLDVIAGREKVIIVDAVQGGGEPGTVYHFTPEELEAGPRRTSSVHQLGLLETLSMARHLGWSPGSVSIYGIEPLATEWGSALSPEVAAAIPRVAELIVEEIRASLTRGASALARRRRSGGRPVPSPFAKGEGRPLPSPFTKGEGQGEGYLEGTQIMPSNLNKDELEAKRVERRRHLRKQPTDAESLLWQMIRGRQLGGSKFRRQHQVGPYVLDFYCPERRLAIEADGGQHYDPEGLAADELRTCYLEDRGIRVLRFSNVDILSQSKSVLEAIWGAVVGEMAREPSP